MKRVLCISLLIATTGCASIGDSVLGDHAADIVAPEQGEKFTPAVGYMSECVYAGTKGGNFFTRNADNSILESSCLASADLLERVQGLTFKYKTVFEGPQGPVTYYNSRSQARAGGRWIDPELEKKVGAKYRFIFQLPSIGSVPNGNRFIVYPFTVQRISDGKIMKVQPSSSGERSAQAATTSFIALVKKVLADPANTPPLWHSPF